MTASPSSCAATRASAAGRGARTCAGEAPTRGGSHARGPAAREHARLPASRPGRDPASNTGRAPNRAQAEPGAGASIQDTLAKLDDVSAAIADSNTRFDAELAAGGAAAASQASADGAEKLASREAYLNDLADSLEVAEARIREEAAAAAAAVEGAASEAAAAAAAAAEGVKAAAAEVIDKVEGAIEAAVEKAEAAVAGAVEGAKEKAAGAAAGELVKVRPIWILRRDPSASAAGRPRPAPRAAQRLKTATLNTSPGVLRDADGPHSDRPLRRPRRCVAPGRARRAPADVPGAGRLGRGLSARTGRMGPGQGPGAQVDGARRRGARPLALLCSLVVFLPRANAAALGGRPARSRSRFALPLLLGVGRRQRRLALEELAA